MLLNDLPLPQDPSSHLRNYMNRNTSPILAFFLCLLFSCIRMVHSSNHSHNIIFENKGRTIQLCHGDRITLRTWMKKYIRVDFLCVVDGSGIQVHRSGERGRERSSSKKQGELVVGFSSEWYVNAPSPSP